MPASCNFTAASATIRLRIELDAKLTLAVGPGWNTGFSKVSLALLTLNVHGTSVYFPINTPYVVVGRYSNDTLEF